MKKIDFSKWAVVAHKDDSALGRMAQDAMEVLGAGKHLVVPSERFWDKPTAGPKEILFEPGAPREEIETLLSGLEGVIFFERNNWHPDLLSLAQKMEIMTVGVPMWEWFRADDERWGLCNLLACPNEYCLRVLRKHRIDNAVMLPWALDLDRVPRREITGPARLFIHNAGVIDADDRKGTEDTVKAFGRVRRTDIKLIVRSQKKTKLQEKDKRVDLREGNLEEQKDLYAEGDVAIQPSRMEGLGFSILEAVCSGMPVITTNYPPMNEYVEDKELLVRTRWFKRKAFSSKWVSQAHLKLPNIGGIARAIEWCAGNDMAGISRRNRAWAEDVFAKERIKKLWTETLEKASNG